MVLHSIFMELVPERFVVLLLEMPFENMEGMSWALGDLAEAEEAVEGVFP